MVKKGSVGTAPEGDAALWVTEQRGAQTPARQGLRHSGPRGTEEPVGPCAVA